MVDVNAQNKTISISVSSSGTSSNVNASGDTAMYYSNKSKEYAISDRLIDGKYRSSKYYSEQAQQSAIQAEGAKELVLEAKDGVVAEVIQEGENQRESLQAETQNQILVLKEASEKEQETITEIKESIGQGKAVYLGENEPTDDIYSVWVSPEDDEVTLMIKDIEVNLDNIATDLNGKADVDLSNVNPSQTFKENSVSWGMPDYYAGIALSIGNQFTAPCDGIFKMYGFSASTSLVLYASIYDEEGNYLFDIGTQNGSTSNSKRFTVIYPIPKGYKITVGDIYPTNATTIFYPFKGVNQ